MIGGNGNKLITGLAALLGAIFGGANGAPQLPFNDPIFYVGVGMFLDGLGIKLPFSISPTAPPYPAPPTVPTYPASPTVPGIPAAQPTQPPTQPGAGPKPFHG